MNRVQRRIREIFFYDIHTKRYVFNYTFRSYICPGQYIYEFKMATVVLRKNPLMTDDGTVNQQTISYLMAIYVMQMDQYHKEYSYFIEKHSTNLILIVGMRFLFDTILMTCYLQIICKRPICKRWKMYKNKKKNNNQH